MKFLAAWWRVKLAAWFSTAACWAAWLSFIALVVVMYWLTIFSCPERTTVWRHLLKWCRSGGYLCVGPKPGEMINSPMDLEAKFHQMPAEFAGAYMPWYVTLYRPPNHATKPRSE